MGYGAPTRGVRASYPWGTALLPVGYGARARGVDFTRAPPSVAGTYSVKAQRIDEKPSDGGFVRVETAGGSALYPITYCAH